MACSSARLRPGCARAIRLAECAGERVIDAPAAAHLQALAISVRRLLKWQVWEAPAGYPGLIIARPAVLPSHHELPRVLAAGTLEELRRALPPGLVYLTRAFDDPPELVESWF